MKKYIRVLTTILLLITIITPQKSWAQTSSKPAVGDGSEENPFQIGTYEELSWFRDWVNGIYTPDNGENAVTHLSACLKLTNNIDMKNCPWTPIGIDYNNYFFGKFDGNGKTISNLYVNYNKHYAGLFAFTNEATIRNLTIINAKVIGNDCTGILAGMTRNSQITGIRIKDSSVEGNELTGGVVGNFSDSKLVNCESNAIVKGSNYVGGITGNSIRNCLYENIFVSSNVSSTGTEEGLLFGQILASASIRIAGLVAFSKEAKLILKGTELQGNNVKAIGNGSITTGFILGCDNETLKSGVVSFLLQQKNTSDDVVWGQKLSTDDGDVYPVLGSANKVYANNNVTLTCNGNLQYTGTFSNTESEEETELRITHNGTSEYKAGTPATCTENGTLNHYECSNCHSAFEDQQLTIEIADIKDPAKSHNYGTDDICLYCNKQMPTVTVGENSVQIERVKNIDLLPTGYNLFKFVPTKSGIFEYTSSGDTYISLWNSDKSERLYYIKQRSSTLGKVEAENTYYIGLRESNAQPIDGNTTLTIQLTFCPEHLSGIGTESEPFILQNAEHLKFFADYVNGTGEVTSDHCNAYAKIADDVDEIDMSSVCHPVGNDYDTEISWTPISNTICWYGTFDGNGKTISNLYINGNQEKVGLFGSINGTIQNLTLKNSNVTNTGSNTGILLGYQGRACNINNVNTYGSINGANYTGGIVGYSMKGTVSNCENHATVAGQKYVGGIRGGSINNYSDGSFSNCSNYGNITGTDEYVGGIVGYIYGIYIGNCANYGSIQGKNRVGGIAGYTEYDHAENVLNYGDITSTEGNVVGSLFGYVNNCKGFLAYNKEAKFTVNNQQQNANAIGSGSTGAVAATAFTKQQMKSGEVAFFLNGSKSTGNLAWYQKLGENGDAYPVLTSTGDNKVYGSFHHRATERFYTNDASVKEHSVAYNAEAEDEANGNHDLSYEAGEYTWTDAEDKTQDPTVAVTYTCKVCGNAVTPEQMAVEHDAEHDNEAATCTEAGHKYYKTSYTFNDKAVFSNTYTQTLPALGHEMSDDVTFNDSKSIYQKGCTRENCDHHDYYATSDGSVKAKANDDASTFTVDKLTLNDATAYDSKAEFTVKDLEYNRSFSHDKWQAVYLPFDLACGQISDDYEVATINNFHEFEQKDGGYNIVLEVKPVRTGVTIPALTPCLIRMKQAPEMAVDKTFHFAEVSFAAAADKKIDCSSVTRYYQFLGTLNQKTGFDESSDFVLNLGELYRAGSETQLNPQRWYLNATDREGSQLNPSVQLSRIAIHVIGGDETTGIDGIYVKTDTEGTDSTRQGIYDMQGRKLNQEPTSGIYIKDGKKYVK